MIHLFLHAYNCHCLLIRLYFQPINKWLLVFKKKKKVLNLHKVSASNAGDLGLIPGSGRSPGEGNDNPLQYSCLKNPMDGGTRWATVHGVAKSQTRLSDLTFTFNFHMMN